MPSADRLHPRLVPATTLLALLVLISGPPGRAELADVTLETVVDGLEDPVDVTHAGDGRLFVTELRGTVRIVEDGELYAEPFLDITDRVPIAGHGLLSIAFHPDYLDPDSAGYGFVFLHRVEKSTLDFLVTRVRVSADDPDRVDTASEVVLIRLEKELRRHYGGRLRFGPDGYLYGSTGDGSGGQDGGEVIFIDPECASQSLSRLEGKMLRLDVDQNAEIPPYYGIPPDNPFPGSEIWAYGLRNPWRFSFDRETGDLWIGDVGEDEREEVNFQPASSPGGENYGWKVMEATACFGDTAGCLDPVPVCNSPALTPPLLEYSHVNGHCSVTGGVVYRGSLPSLYGRYLYGDFCSGTIWAARRDDAGVWSTQELSVELPRVFAFEEVGGDVYLTAEGALYRLVDPTVPAAGLLEFATTEVRVAENAGQTTISVRRVEGGVGAVQVDVLRGGGTASLDDFPFIVRTVEWADGETGVKSFTVPVHDDDVDEPDETVPLHLSRFSPRAALGGRTSALYVILDDDEPTCVPDFNHLCLNDRFRVSVTWRTGAGQTGQGVATSLGADSGSFWFFGANNPEIFVKVLDACFDPFNAYWVFAAGLTDVETSLVVTDTATGEVRRYDRRLGVSYEAVRDTSAFATCP